MKRGFSRQHKKLLLRDAVLAAFCGATVALIPGGGLSVIGRLVIWFDASVVAWGIIIATDKAIADLVRREKRLERNKDNAGTTRYVGNGTVWALPENHSDR